MDYRIPRLPLAALLWAWLWGWAMLAVASEPALPAAVEVTQQPLRELRVHAEREAPATVLSLNESRIIAEVSAVVREIPVEVGQVVAAGAVLVRLDPRDYELARQHAEAALESVLARIELAKFQLDRARELRTRNFVSDDTLTQRQTELKVLHAERASATAQLERARHDLEKCTLTAPFEAVVQSRSAQLGELAVAGAPLFTLIDLAHVEVSAQIQSKDAASLRAADGIHFSTATEGQSLHLLRISPVIDRGTRTQEVRLAFDGEAAAPGSEGLIRWRAVEPLLPADLISRREGRLGVFIATGAVARFVVLEQAQEGRPVRIDLPPDTPIILDGRFGLHDGDRIAPRR
ncbi:MAG: efflux RND transporter periplasmic adaptor subunit [Gammaproteobacteria bacterium]